MDCVTTLNIQNSLPTIINKGKENVAILTTRSTSFNFSTEHVGVNFSNSLASL